MMVAVPIAPAAFSTAQRSVAEPTCDFTGPGASSGSSAIHVNRNLAPQIHTGQIVILGFRHAQAVTHEHHRRLRRRRQVRPCALCSIQPVQDFLPSLALQS